jgi:putative copper resistance protein D
MTRTASSHRLKAVAVVLLATLAGLAPAIASAHGTAAAEPSFPSLLASWEFDPLFMASVALANWAYIAAVRRANRAHPHSPVPRRQMVCFLLGMGTLVLAIMSPIAAYDTDLFSVHMVQHVLIIMIAAPLLLLGAPITLALRASSPRVRKGVILPILHSWPVKAVSWPVFTWLLLAGVMWASHFSSLFNGALEHEWLHRFEHVLYLASALLFWWPAINADPSPWRMNHPMRMLYVFMQMPQNSFLAVTIANATSVIFPHYASVARDWGPSPLADQEWAGYIMWVGGDIAFLVVLACLGYGWAQHEEREGKRADRTLARQKAAAASNARLSPPR